MTSNKLNLNVKVNRLNLNSKVIIHEPKVPSETPKLCLNESESEELDIYKPR